jgi:hypothetical protein
MARAFSCSIAPWPTVAVQNTAALNALLPRKHATRCAHRPMQKHATRVAPLELSDNVSRLYSYITGPRYMIVSEPPIHLGGFMEKSY